MVLNPLLKNGKKKKLKPLSKLKKELWAIFSDWVKREGKNICFTCGRFCEGKNAHGGHFIKKSIGGIELYFHPDNVKVQCYRCNIFLDGNQYEFGIRLGKDVVKKLEKIRAETKGKQWDRKTYEEKIKHYKQLVENEEQARLI